MNNQKNAKQQRVQKLNPKAMETILTGAGTGMAGPSFLQAMSAEGKEIDDFLKKISVQPEDSDEGQLESKARENEKSPSTK